MKCRLPLFCSVALLSLTGPGLAADLIDESWQSTAPRGEIRPHFRFDAKGGRAGTAALVIETDDREGLSGSWFKEQPVQGGQHYRFTAYRFVEGVADPRRNVVARLLWQDEKGGPVPFDGPMVTSVLKGWKPEAEPEYPFDGAADAQGWVPLAGV